MSSNKTNINWKIGHKLIIKGVPDADIANRLKCSESAVRTHRIKLGINKRKRFDWDLGQRMIRDGCSNSEIALRLNCTEASVTWQRRQMGVSGRHGGNNMYDWSIGDEMIQAGISDAEVAEVVGCHKRTVTVRRLKVFKIFRDCDGCSVPKIIDWKLVDDMTDNGFNQKEISKKCGCSVSTLRIHNELREKRNIGDLEPFKYWTELEKRLNAARELLGIEETLWQQAVCMPNCWKLFASRLSNTKEGRNILTDLFGNHYRTQASQDWSDELELSILEGE